MVLVTSRFYNDYILGALGELSVGYMMRKALRHPRYRGQNRRPEPPYPRAADNAARPSDAGDQSAAFP